MSQPWTEPSIAVQPTPVAAPPAKAQIIALVNQKGGVGKTTSTVSIGAALAELGQRVLLVDFDPQGALSVALGIPAHELDVSIYNVLVDGVPIQDALQMTDVPGLDLVPSNIDLSAAEVQLVSEVGREHALARALAPLLGDYDYVLIDCQPSLGLLTVNALTCADGIIIPLACEFFALRGVALLMDTVGKVQQRLNPKLHVVGVLATMYNAQTHHTREVLASVKQGFGDLVFETPINRTIKFPDAQVAGEPITVFASTSPGAVAYRDVAREIIARTQPGQA